MISILIDGKPLFIAKGTSLQIEVNNALFSTEKIEGDVMFTFDVPAEKNDNVLRHARYTYVRRVKKYACKVLAGGIEIANGELYLQKATAKTYSCGLVINPFPTDFAETQLKDNDYGEDLLISRASSEQQAGWLSFLQASLAEDSVFKFPLFVDEEFYGKSNSAFGWFLLPTDDASDAPSGYQASVNTDDSVALDHFYLNRLFTDSNGNIIEALTGNRGVRIFNTRTVDNPNSFAFCPAIRLTWLLERVVENGGYSLAGNFTKDESVRRIFSQSLRAMDGLPTQYEDVSANATVNVSPDVEFFESTTLHYVMPFNDGVTRKFYEMMTTTTGDYDFDVTLRTYLPANAVSSAPDPDYPGEINWQVLCFMLMDENAQMPNFLNQDGTESAWTQIGTLNNGDFTPITTFRKIFHPASDLASFGYNGAGFYTLHFHFTQRLTAGVKYHFFFGNLSAIVFMDAYNMTSITGCSNSPVTQDVASFYNLCNVFSNKLRYADHVPKVTNGDFLNTICNAFGLALFVDSGAKRMEFTFFKDIIGKARSLDLSAYVDDRETAITKNDEKKYVYKLEGISSETIDETKVLPPVVRAADLPDAVINYGKVCFVENENAYRIAEREGDAIDNWVFKWNPLCGNVLTLELGDGEAEEVTPSAKVPSMKIIDGNKQESYRSFLPVISQTGCSTIFDTGSTEFDMILMSYYGRRPFTTAGGTFHYEAMRPTCMTSDGTMEDGISLTPTGDQSVGELYVRPWLSFLSDYEKVTLKMMLPLTRFLEVWQLLKPQNTSIERQNRWILVDNVRYLPIKMTFQFKEGSRLVVANVECAKERTER